MKTLSDYLLQESAPATNVVGAAIASTESPAAKRHKKDCDCEVCLASRISEQYVESKFGQTRQFTIPHAEYENIKFGRVRYSKWSSFLSQPDFRERVRQILYGKGSVVLTSDYTGASVILKHNRMSRQKKLQEILESEDIIEIEEAEIINEAQDLVFGDDDDDEFYDPAYDYAFDELGYDETHSDLFANLVLAFFYIWTDTFDDDNTDVDDKESITVEDIAQAAAEFVDEEALELGHKEKTSPETVQELVRYIEDNFYLDSNQAKD